MADTNMDWQKTLLIAAMCAVSFTLVIRWNDFEPTGSADTGTQAQAPQAQQEASNGSGELPKAQDTADEQQKQDNKAAE